MSEAPALVLALLAGVLLAALFFGGLWWTVRQLVTSPHPAVLLIGSLLLRTAITLASFWFLAQADWRRLLACLLGFFLARMVAIRLVRLPLQGAVS